MNKTFCFKLYRTERKEKYLDGLLSIAAEIWNKSIELGRKHYEENKKSLKKNDLQKLIKEIRNSDGYERWQALHSQTVQEVTDRIYKGYDKFFRDVKQKKKSSPPKFKHSSKYKSITFKQCGYKFHEETNSIKIGKTWFKYHKSRNIEGKVKTIIIKKNNLGEWFIFIVTDYQAESKSIIRSGKSVGFDFGLKTFLTGSDGNNIESPLFFEQDRLIIAKLSKALSSKKRDSKNRQKAKLALAKAYDKIANRRKNFHWETALQLVRTYDVICFETLNMNWMKSNYGKKVSDLGFYEFLQSLKHLAGQYDCQIVFISKTYPSTQTCSNCLDVCGPKGQEELDVREWDCIKCHAHHDRDFNAALNIHRVGTSTLAGVSVRPKDSLESFGRKC